MMDTARLRRTFKYPSDTDDPPDLDEEHQEELLSSLKAEDEATNKLYQRLFLALPTVVSIAFVPSLFTSGDVASALVAVSSIIVPAIAAYLLYFHPILTSERQGLLSFSLQNESKDSARQREQVVVMVGASIAGILTIFAGRAWMQGRGENAVWTFLPARRSSFTLLILHKADILL